MHLTIRFKYVMCCASSPPQPHIANIESSIGTRKAEIVKLQGKINKVEDQVSIERMGRGGIEVLSV